MAKLYNLSSKRAYKSISALEVVLIKPNGYSAHPKGNGYVKRYKFGTMPNGTLPDLRSLIPSSHQGVPIIVTAMIDEYIETDLKYLRHLQKPTDKSRRKLVIIGGVQSWQLQHALDLATLAHKNGCLVIVGGPHFLSCQSDNLYGRGISFGVAEAQLVFGTIFDDAIKQGHLQDSYGDEQRWAKVLQNGLIEPPAYSIQKWYGIKMLGYNLAAGCPFDCSFCSVTVAFGKQIRTRPFNEIINNLLHFKQNGLQIVMLTSDNFNKIPNVKELLKMMIEAKIDLPFFAQCDTQLEDDEELLSLMMQANCTQIFIGLESLIDENLKEVHKFHNLGDGVGEYKRNVFTKTKNLVNMIRKYKINSQLATIIGFRNDNPARIAEQIGYIEDINPDIPSCYIRTPLPGSLDGKKFDLNDELAIRNLDYYDCTHSVTKHQYMSAVELENQLYNNFYRRLYSLDHFRKHAQNILDRGKPGPAQDIFISALYHGFSRYAAWQKMHPLGGGFCGVVLDSASDYADLRKQYFGDILDKNNLFPFPILREVSEIEEKQNKEIRDEIRALKSCGNK